MKIWPVAIGAWLAVTFSTAMAGNLSAQDALEERRRILAQREAEVNRTTRDTANIQRYIGLLKDFRDNKLFGASGLASRLEAWNAAFHEWTNAWDGLAADFAITNESNIVTRVDGIQVSIRDRAEQLVRLRQKAAELSAETHRLKLDIPPLDEATIPESPELARQINSNIFEAEAIYAEIARSFSQDVQKSFAALASSATKVMRAKLVDLGMRFPQLRTQLAAAQATLDFIDRFEPRISSLSMQSEEIVAAVSASRMFAAKDALERLEREAANLNNEVAASTAPESLKQMKVQDVQRMLNATRGHYERTFALSTAFGHLARFASQQRPRLSRDCRDPQLAPHRNCELLRVLNAVDMSPSALRRLSEQDLTYIEARLEKAAKPAAWQMRGQP